MNLHNLLTARARKHKPLRVALIGAGKFGSMFLSQARRTAGLHLVAVVDLSPTRARESLARVGWVSDEYAAASLAQAQRSGRTCVTDDALAAIASDAVEIVIDATGSPAAGIRHALACCEHGKHIVMVNVEADALAGPLLARRAAQAGIVYSLAYGDQPALICEMVDWARAAGFEVIAAGKGTKSAIEMAAVANATGLTPAPGGLGFPPCGADELPRVLRPRDAGGTLHHRGQVEVISSLQRDGQPVFRDLRWGVYVTFAADSEYVRRCFSEYGLITDESGNYSAMYKPYHLIGLELGISVASVSLRGEATGCATDFRGDVVAVAKRDLKAGEMLDGEGGYTVYGRLMPAQDSLACKGLPIGLAHGIKLIHAVDRGTVVTWQDVAGPDNDAARFRREMEAEFAGKL